MDKTEEFLKAMYHGFNMRDIDTTLKAMHKDVEWPNAMEGIVEHGHEAVRSYWTRQWTLIDPRVDPVDFSVEDDGRINVTVHQVVHDLQGKLLADQTVHHVYKMKGGLVQSMEIR